uniref:tyrosine-type recombinase/integrase n=1 Tax=Saccharopolyspora galaxeae TaxID=2781241 RepID=UPI001F451F07|nr:integrase [Saccharopolyspora sp. HNM0986]
MRRHEAHGMCRLCFQRDPDRPFVRGDNLIARLTDPPRWLPDCVAYLAEHHSVDRACDLITTLGQLLTDGHSCHPQQLLERARQPGRSMGTLARALEDFFVERHLALPTDHAARLAAGRRQRRIAETPKSLRAAVAAFETALLRARQRSSRARTRPRADSTLDSLLSTVRDLARFLFTQRGKPDWATVDIHDIEAFLAQDSQLPRRRLPALRQFFRFARTHRLVLIDPTAGLSTKAPNGFIGQTLTMQQQRDLFRRWTTDTSTHPHEALIGILALLHGASSREVQHLQCTDIDPADRTIRTGQRPHPVPLDPASWAILQRCLTHRQAQHTSNPHLVVNHITRTRSNPASANYLNSRLPDGVTPRTLRGTRLLDLVNGMDPKLVAVAFGMHPQAAMRYLADHADADHLTSTTPPNP